MKKLLIILSLLFLGISYLSAQTPLKHPKKMYRSSKGHLYINQNQPMYLFLGTTPNPADSKRLESESSPQYANPFYFDTEGYNTIRTPSKVDTVTKKVVYPIEDIIFEVYADGMAPISVLNLVGSKKYVKDGIVYYGKNLVGVLKRTDKTSGVEKSFTSVDGAAFSEYNDTLDFASEKAYKLKYYSVDHVGNVESVKSKEFQVDLTAPVVNWRLEGDVQGNTVSARSKIEILADDKLTGVSAIKYQIDDGPMHLYSGPILLSMIPDGDHQFKYFAVDNVGNSTAGGDLDNGLTVKAFIIDKEAPTVEASVEGDSYKGNYLFASNRSTVKIDAEDDQLGISKILYEINSVNLTQTYTEPIKLIDKKGLQSVYYQAFDMVSNKTVVKKLSVYLDNEEPVSGVNYGAPKFFTRDTLFVNDKTAISLFSKDDESGVKKIEYSIDNAAFVEGKSLKLSKEGYHSIKFKATDNVNNTEQIKESEVVVDLEGPEIFVNFSIKAIRSEQIDGQEISVYPPYVKMYIAATDKYCGAQSIYYSIDGGKQLNYSVGQGPSDIEMFTNEKLYKVAVVAKDKLGNKETKEILFRVAKK